MVGIIVPDFEALEQIDKVLNDGNILKDSVRYKQISDIIEKELRIQEKKYKLNGFEKVKKFKLISEDFTNENGLLTISMKLKRNVAKKRFEKEIKEMYQIKSKL